MKGLGGLVFGLLSFAIGVIKSVIKNLHLGDSEFTTTLKSVPKQTLSTEKSK